MILWLLSPPTHPFVCLFVFNIAVIVVFHVYYSLFALDYMCLCKFILLFIITFVLYPTLFNFLSQPFPFRVEH